MNDDTLRPEWWRHTPTGSDYFVVLYSDGRVQSAKGPTDYRSNVAPALHGRDRKRWVTTHRDEFEPLTLEQLRGM